MKNKILKIAIYSGEIPSTTFIERLILGVSERGNHVLLFGILRKQINYPKGHNISVIGYKFSKLAKALHFIRYYFLLSLFRRKDKRKLDGLLKQASLYSLNNRLKSYPVLWYKPDIFHLQWVKGIADWMWVKKFGIKIVVSLRGAHINYSPLASKKLATVYSDCFPFVDGFHAVSNEIMLESKKYGLQEHKAAVIYSGIEVESENSIKYNKSKITTILSVGRSHWIKGYKYAIDACIILKDRGISFKYIIIGGDSSLELKYQVNELQLNDNVELLGRQPYNVVKEHMIKADILFLPSLKEGLANVVLEAMALRTVVLSTDCGGMPEVINDGLNGFLVSSRQPKIMAEKIIEIIDKPENFLNNIKGHGLQTIVKNHNKDNMIDKMTTLYNQVK